ncbi:hypothetical protein AC579_2744 [Pseudocercospora musae]|uniref:DUF7704 domain-containing protein n=1 Tax=Pseudocercospora musae TaxID=113226 RepID=A0A139GT62_9PEZI|nr:hypothetical protein AC579_2744 [Pseudocercospora musae]
MVRWIMAPAQRPPSQTHFPSFTHHPLHLQPRQARLCIVTLHLLHTHYFLLYQHIMPATAMAMNNVTATATPIPWPYRLFFLYIEPISTLVGAYFAHFRQAYYMHHTHPPTAARLPGVSTRESIVLSQLANLYLAFTLTEALVLRATTSRRVWNTLLLVLLIADFGHLYSVKAAGLQVYTAFTDWNAMYWGNLGFVYVGALHRSCFLLGIGLPASSAVNAKLNT